jgi:acyl dehydratase
MNARLDRAAIGDTVAEHTYGPIGREDLKRFAEASGDSNPLHLDPVFAAKAGFDDVIVHGMLGMALLGRLLDEQIAPQELFAFRSRFRRIIKIDQPLLCRARLTDRSANKATLALQMLDPSHDVLIEGTATVGFGALL